jgi:two-component system, NarL family, sensor kinase
MVLLEINKVALLVGGIAILSILVFFIVIFISLYQKRYYTHLKEKQEMHSSFQQELLKTRLEIQEDTFRNISQEIHDNIGQALSFVKLNLNTVDPYNSALVIDKLAESRQLITKTIQDLRDIAKSLNTDFISEIGLQVAIEQQLQMIERTKQYQTSFSIKGEVLKNNPQRELVVYRIVQELLNNIVKHADANSINIEMQYLSEKLIITVQDNGKGFDIIAARSVEMNTGLGLRNMTNRMNMIKGTIDIYSSAGAGTKAIIEIPKLP